MDKDKLNIKEWAEKKDKELRETIIWYVSQGMERQEAINKVLSSSTLGEGYNAQIRHDFIGFTV